MTATFVKTAASMSVLIMIIKSIKASSAFAPQSMVLPPKVATVAVSMTLLADSSFPSQTLEITSFPRGPKRVAVTGATGRTGRLVVDELLRRKVKVVALVRDLEKAATTLPPPRAGDDLTILQCDLGNEEEIQKCESYVMRLH